MDRPGLLVLVCGDEGFWGYGWVFDLRALRLGGKGFALAQRFGGYGRAGNGREVRLDNAGLDADRFREGHDDERVGRELGLEVLLEPPDRADACADARAHERAYAATNDAACCRGAARGKGDGRECFFGVILADDVAFGVDPGLRILIAVNDGGVERDA